MQKKYIIPLFILCLLALIGFFHRSMINFFIERQVRNYVSRTINGDLQFLSIRLTENQITLTGPSITVDSHTLLAADEAIIDYKANLPSRQVDAHVSFSGLQVFLNPHIPAPTSYELQKRAHNVLFHWDVTFASANGLLCIDEQKIPMHMTQTDNQIRLDFLFHNTDCSKLFFLENGLPKVLINCKIQRGIANGRIQLTYLKGQLLDTAGELRITNLQLASAVPAKKDTGPPRALKRDKKINEWAIKNKEVPTTTPHYPVTSSVASLSQWFLAEITGRSTNTLNGHVQFLPDREIAFSFSGISPSDRRMISFELKGCRHSTGWDASLTAAESVTHVAAREGHFSFDVRDVNADTFPLLKKAIQGFGIYLNGVEMSSGHIGGQFHFAQNQHPTNSPQILSMDMSIADGTFHFNELPGMAGTITSVNGKMDLSNQSLSFLWNGLEGTLLGQKNGSWKNFDYACKLTLAGFCKDIHPRCPNKPIDIWATIANKEDTVSIAGELKINEEILVFSLSSAPSCVIGELKAARLSLDPFILTDIYSKVKIAEKKMLFEDIQIFTSGVFFGGVVDIDLEERGGVKNKITIHTNTMCGRVSQLQHLLSYVDPQCSLLKIPLTGTVGTASDGGKLSIKNFTTDHPEIAGSFHGIVSEGALCLPALHTEIQNLSFDFVYHHESNLFTARDIQSSILVGKLPNAREEYLFSGDYIKLENCINSGSPSLQNRASFDFWIGDRTRDMMRFVGHTTPRQSPSGGFDVILDPELTHIGDGHPVVYDFVINERRGIENLHISCPLHLHTMWHDLQRFMKTQLFTLPSKLFKKLDHVRHPSGEVIMDFKYAENSSGNIATFNFNGKDICIDDAYFKKIIVNGKKQENIWTVENFQLDNLLISVDIVEQEDVWHIPFFGLHLGKMTLLGMQGRFFPQKNSLHATLNLFEIDTAHPDDCQFISKFVKGCQLEGVLKGTGDIKIDLLENTHRWKIETTLNGAVHALRLPQYPIQYQGSEDIPISISATLLPDSSCLRIAVPDGPYLIYNHKLDLRNLTLEYGTRQITINGECFVQREWVPFHSRAKPKWGCGEVAFKDPSNNGSQLAVWWETDPILGLAMTKIDGKLFETEVSLARIETPLAQDQTFQNSLYQLKGTINCNGKQLWQLLGSSLIPLSEKCRELDGKYTIDGQWVFDRKEIIPSQFSGRLHGSTCMWNGCVVDELSALVQGFREEIQLSQVKIKNAEWGMVIDHINLMKTPQSDAIKGCMELTHPVSFPSFLAKTDFDSDMKKILIPATGNIHFEIQSEKIFITRLEHAYSENKLSKFSLSKNHGASYIGFNGELCLQLQIKPYQMISKLASLFTLSIGGSLKDPICNIYLNSTHGKQKRKFISAEGL